MEVGDKMRVRRNYVRNAAFLMRRIRRQFVAQTSGPENYAPPSRRSAENSNGQAVDAVVSEIRQFIRRDEPLANRQRADLDSPTNPAAENLSAHVRRIAGMSMEEIDRVIRELEGVRDMLQDEGQRVTREIASYAGLSQAATTAMRVIGESIKQWKDGSEQVQS
jgi:hypothetical protein